MNTAKLKRFAQDARKKLLEQIAAKLEYALSADTAELREQAAQVRALKDELGTTGKAALAEKVAYTWFNRLVALRFLDVNGYQPLDVRVISPKEGYTSPELLDDAKEGHVPDDLKVNAQRVFDLLDGRVPSANPQNEAYRLLLIAACNHLHSVLPFLFERINDYTELLLPDDLTSELSVLHDVREGMTAEDCQQVEIIGWLYQFYISEKKDEVFASKAKVKKEDIPAATQLFTPRWIVEYMVQNTVGKLWLQNRPASGLREHMPYFIESASLHGDDYLKIGSPQELTLLDPACGSGHILVYGFELLARIYEEEGYSPSEIPQLILEHNLFGFEIDERAAQLAAMALMMKARGYQRRLFKKGRVPQPHILCFQDLKLDTKELGTAISNAGIKASDALIHDLNNMRQATNLGSLIIPDASALEISDILKKIKGEQEQADLFTQYNLKQLKSALEQLQLLKQQYTCISANPPYMGGGNMNIELSTWVGVNHPLAKSDLFSCFIERCLDFVPEHGLNGLVTMESWMFLSSFKDFRKNLIENAKIHSLSHFGWHIMRIAFGTASFIIEKTTPSKLFKGVYSYMEHDNINTYTERPKSFPLLNNGRYNVKSQSEFERIPGSPIAYWLSEKVLNIFSKELRLSDVGEAKQGLATADNNRFIRIWSEVAKDTTCINANSAEAFKDSGSKWAPYNKGGAKRKWYGNQEYVVNWERDGFQIKNFRDERGKTRSAVRNPQFYFRESISWGLITSGGCSFRLYPNGFIYDVAGMSYFANENSRLILGILNTKFYTNIAEVLNPTINLQIGDVANMPYTKVEGLKFEFLVNDCISISEAEWNSRETSWNFQQNEVIRIMGNDLEEAYYSFCLNWTNKFLRLHTNEEELNRQFIETYGLEGELTPDVPLKDITILQEETSIENGQLVFHAQEVMAQFVSYAVGCMFGRYSLDKPGLILANQGETLEDYLSKVGKDEHEVAFLPDADNIIPVLDGDWYEDDITGRFLDFLKATFGAANLAKNLAFVQECLGKDIRKYFVKDFYTDHIQRYKKRPIYWLFSSPQGSFNALVYLHRYTPDTVNTLLNQYLRDYLEKLRTRREHLVRVEADGTATDKARAAKEKEALDKVLLELQEYERNVLYPLATERIALDLDHGVLVNYNRFGKALKAVPGLNDAKAQKQVREFDWVETTTA